MRVAVTTSADSSERVAAPLREAGLEPVELPCIEVRPADEAALDRLRREASDAEMVFLTSARSVAILWPAGGMPPVPCAVVGPATAAAVEAAGGEVAVVGSGGGDELVDLVEGEVRGRRIVFPHARASDPVRAERLRGAGADVVRGAAYDTIPVAPGDAPVDAALFGSPSAVEGWRLTRSIVDLGVVGAMGPTTASALDRAGRIPEVVADPPSVESLVRGLVAHLDQRRG
jgi:uroporphyrinogen-III synthase